MRPKILLAIQKGKSNENESASPAVLRKLAGYDHEDMPPDYQPWLLKFDSEPEQCRGLLESACAAMAREAGNIMPETRLIRTESLDGTRMKDILPNSPRHHLIRMSEAQFESSPTSAPE